MIKITHVQCIYISDELKGERYKIFHGSHFTTVSNISCTSNYENTLQIKLLLKVSIL